MKSLRTLILLLSIQVCGYSQNLVNNWSFEDTAMCPVSFSQISNANYWVSYSHTPDLFNSCWDGIPASLNNVDVPLNILGYQDAHSGQAYSGSIFYSIFDTQWREAIGTMLNQPLVVGTRYFISFYVARASKIYMHASNIAIDRIGLQFYTYSHSSINPVQLNNFSHVSASSIISDTLNWTLINGSIIADSAYQYISISNFYDSTNTNYLSFDSTALRAYYFIDDICISADSLFCDQLLNLDQTQPVAFQFIPKPGS